LLTSSRLLDSGQATDLAVVCGAGHRDVHGFVLALHSDVLGKAYKGAFSESLTKTIDLSDDGEECVKALIEYCYTFEYKVDSLPMHVSMVVIADKYNIKSLANYATERFGSRLQTSVSHDELFAAAKLVCGTEGVTEKMRGLVVDNATKAGDPGLRDALIEW
jgi:hypothetical protein